MRLIVLTVRLDADHDCCKVRRLLNTLLRSYGLRCVDIAPEQYGDPKFIDAKRLGQFALAARVDDAVEFFQLETGTKVTVQEMKDALTKEWQGKISDSDLKYILGKVVSNGSGIHIHVLFTHDNFHSAYVPESKVAMR